MAGPFNGHVPPLPTGAASEWQSVAPELDRDADLASISAGLRSRPRKPEHRPVLAMQRLKLAGSQAGRAAVLFLLCFAASTLSLRLSLPPTQKSCVVLPVAAPKAMKGPGAVDLFRSWVTPW